MMDHLLRLLVLEDKEVVLLLVVLVVLVQESVLELVVL